MTSNREARALGYTNRLHYKYGDGYASFGQFPTDYTQYPKESYMKSRYGYNVQKKTPVEKRREALSEAIVYNGHSFVQNYLILNIDINWNKTRMIDARKRWREDLDWVNSTIDTYNNLLVEKGFAYYQNGKVYLNVEGKNISVEQAEDILLSFKKILGFKEKKDDIKQVDPVISQPILPFELQVLNQVFGQLLEKGILMANYEEIADSIIEELILREKKEKKDLNQSVRDWEQQLRIYLKQQLKEYIDYIQKF